MRKQASVSCQSYWLWLYVHSSKIGHTQWKYISNEFGTMHSRTLIRNSQHKNNIPKNSIEAIQERATFLFLNIDQIKNRK